MTPTRSLKASSRPLLLLLFIALLIFSLTPNALADEGGKWGAVAERINTNLDQAQKAFESGNVEKAKEHVKEARYGQFVRTGFETEVNAKVSGGDASHADMEFGALGQALNKGDKAKVAKIIDGLKSHIKDNATALDGGTVKAKDLRVSDGKWGQVAQTMNGILDKAVQESKKGNAEAAKDKVNEAYYGHYETTGFEKMTGARERGASLVHRIGILANQKGNLREEDRRGFPAHRPAKATVDRGCQQTRRLRRLRQVHRRFHLNLFRFLPGDFA